MESSESRLGVLRRLDSSMHFRASRLPADQVHYLLHAICSLEHLSRTIAHVGAGLRLVSRRLSSLRQPEELRHPYEPRVPMQKPVPLPHAACAKRAPAAFFVRRGTHPLFTLPYGTGPGPPRRFYKTSSYGLRPPDGRARDEHDNKNRVDNSHRPTRENSRRTGDPQAFGKWGTASIVSCRPSFIPRNASDDQRHSLLLRDVDRALDKNTPTFLFWARTKQLSPEYLRAHLVEDDWIQLLHRCFPSVKREMLREKLSMRRLDVWARRINLCLSHVDRTKWLAVENGDFDGRVVFRHLAVIALLCTGNVKDGIDAARHYFTDRYAEESQTLQHMAALGVITHVLRICQAQHFLLSGIEFVLDVWKPLETHIFDLGHPDNMPKFVLRRGNDMRRALVQLFHRMSLAGSPLPWLKNTRDTFSSERFSHASWLIIRCYIELSVSERALEVFRYAKSLGVDIPQSLQLDLVRALVIDDNFGQARAVLNDLPDHGSSAEILTVAIFLYGHQGELRHADACMDALEHLNKVARHHQLSHLRAAAVSGNDERALELFRAYKPVADTADRLPYPYWTVKFYELLMMAYYEVDKPDEARAVFDEMVREGYTPPMDVYNTMLRYMAKAGDVAGAGEIWQRMRDERVRPSHVTYLQLLTLCAHRADPDGAQAIMDEAARNGIRPTRRMITALMDAHAEAGSWKEVVNIFKSLGEGRDAALRQTVEVFNTVLKAYVKLGAPYKIVRDFFQKIVTLEHVTPNQATYALLVQSASETRHYVQARKLYEQMHRIAKLPTVRDYRAMPMGVMLTSLLPGRSRILYHEMRRQGIELQPETYSAILRAFARRSWDSQEPPRRLLNSILNDTPIARLTGPQRAAALQKIYAPLLKMYSRAGDMISVQQLHEDMLHRGGTPSIVTLWLMMDGFRAAGNMTRVRHLWSQIFQLALDSRDVSAFVPGEVKRTKGSNLLCVPLSTYIHALSEAREMNEISAVWQQVRDQGFGFDANNWTVLCVALVEAGKLDRAMEIVERVLIPAERRARRALRPGVKMRRKEVDTTVAPLDARRRLAAARNIQHLLSRQQHRELLKRMHLTRDITSPLRILGEISPLWNAWAPHKSLLRLLYQKVMQFRRRTPRILRNARDVPGRELEVQRMSAALQSDFPMAMGLINTVGQKAYRAQLARVWRERRPTYHEYRRWFIQRWLSIRRGEPVRPNRLMKDVVNRELHMARVRRRVPWVGYRKWLERWMKQWRDLRLLRHRLWVQRGRPLADGTAGHPKVQADKQRGAKPGRTVKRKAASPGGTDEDRGAGGRRGRFKRWARRKPPSPWQFQREKVERPKPKPRTVFWS